MSPMHPRECQSSLVIKIAYGVMQCYTQDLQGSFMFYNFTELRLV